MTIDKSYMILPITQNGYTGLGMDIPCAMPNLNIPLTTTSDFIPQTLPMPMQSSCYTTMPTIESAFLPLSMPQPNPFNFSLMPPVFNFDFLSFSFPAFWGFSDNTFNNSSKRSSAKGSISRMLEIARGELRKRVRETSKNDSSEIRVYKLGAKNSQPWCAALSTWCAKQAGLCRNGLNWTMSSQEVRTDAGKYFAKKSVYTPKAGDFAIWTNVGDERHGHIGIVDEVSDEYVYIIEGNTSEGTIARNKYSFSSLNKDPRFNGYTKNSEWLA